MEIELKYDILTYKRRFFSLFNCFLFLTQADDEEERQKNELHKLLASEQRTVLSQLYLDRNRPSFDNGVSLEAFTLFH